MGPRVFGVGPEGREGPGGDAEDAGGRGVFWAAHLSDGRGGEEAGAGEDQRGDGERGQHFHRATETLLVIVADGQQIHAVERRREEQPDQDQTHGRAEGVGNHPAQAFVEEGGRHAEHRFRTEPGCEDRRGDHVERQMPPGHGKVADLAASLADQVWLSK